ncbi:hypothetical protein MMC34_004714 [Xylographa carneopallida]|nr:hypothetical protein [Xylographa carneopallida]
MSTLYETALQSAGVLPTVQVAFTTALAFTAGIAFCLSLWVIPVILLASTPASAVVQYIEMIDRGGRYLQPTSRLLALGLFSLTWLIARHPDPAISMAWRYYAICGVLLVLVAPWETFMVFPINDRIKEMGAQLEKAGNAEGNPATKAELERLLRKWRDMHGGRIALLVLATFASAVAIVDT